MIRVRISQRPLRVLGFDLENRPSAYWFNGETTSEITAFCWKFTDEEECHSLILRPDDYFEDDDGRYLPRDMALVIFRNVLCEAGLIFGHNIRNHDLPMFQASLLRRQIPPLPQLLTTDTLKDIPKRRGMAASLDNLATMYGLQGKKFHMTQHTWEQANRLDPDGIALARKRVESDVLLQERLRAKLLELGLLKPARRWNP